MTKQEFTTLLTTSEPLFSFRGVDYQICAVTGGYIAGPADIEGRDTFFDSISSLMDNWVLETVPFAQALPEIVIK